MNNGVQLVVNERVIHENQMKYNDGSTSKKDGKKK